MDPAPVGGHPPQWSLPVMDWQAFRLAILCRLHARQNCRRSCRPIACCWLGVTEHSQRLKMAVPELLLRGPRDFKELDGFQDLQNALHSS